jgi:hypothetical protein
MKKYFEKVLGGVASFNGRGGAVSFTSKDLAGVNGMQVLTIEHTFTREYFQEEMITFDNKIPANARVVLSSCNPHPVYGNLADGMIEAKFHVSDTGDNSPILGMDADSNKNVFGQISLGGGVLLPIGHKWSTEKEVTMKLMSDTLNVTGRTLTLMLVLAQE